MLSKEMTYLKQFCTFITDIIKSRKLIFELTKNDFKKNYLGSYLGILWAFVQPSFTIIILWFVFQVGFRSMPVNNFPFILWLVCGLIPWFFFSESISNATNSVLSNSYLVSKVVFRVSILPIIKILSSVFVHLFFIVFLFFMFLIYGYKPNIYNLQVIYYLFATVILVLGISWLTSSLVVFLRDIGQMVAMLLQFAFWLTPIVWWYKIIPSKYLIVLKLNPVYYIIEGYRNAFIYHKWFWQSPYLTIYFWVVTLILFVLGAIVFKRLRPHFADVL